MVRQIDFEKRTQLYYQLYDILRSCINDGTYKPGDMLPTENQLIEMYGVSRATVRKATEMLCNDSLIEKRRGIGTFVQTPKIKTELRKANHFANLTEELGFIAHTKVISNQRVKADQLIATKLEIAIDTPLINLKRIRYASGMPVRFESAYFELSKYALIESHDFTDGSLRQFLHETYGVSWDRVDEEIFAIAADAKRSEHLQVALHSPLLFGECVFFTANEEPSEFTRVYYRGDLNYFSFSSELS